MLAVMLAVALAFAAPALANHLTGLTLKEGTSGNDALVGTSGGDGLFGRGGDDSIRGLGGGDFIDGDSDSTNTVRGFGRDAINGDSGPDRIYGGPRADALVGGLGNDFIADGRYNGMNPTVGDRAVDAINCGAGVDTVVAEPRDAVNDNCENVTRR